jgi:hypothetical protein
VQLQVSTFHPLYNLTKRLGISHNLIVGENYKFLNEIELPQKRNP